MSSLNQQVENFSFWIPAKMYKSSSKDPKKAGKRWIQGIASTDGIDLQGEIVSQNGIDFSYFLTDGWFNDDHKSGPEHKVGVPTEAKVTSKGLWVKGYLLDNPDPSKPSRADFYWGLMQQLEASGADRKVGFSVQGKVLRKAGNVIEKCWISEIAITCSPVNNNTWAELVKSLNAGWGSKRTQEEETVGKSLTFPQAVAFLEVYHKLPREAAESVAKVVFQSRGAEI